MATSRSDNNCPMMMSASMRRTLAALTSLGDIIGDSDMSSRRVTSSCNWRRGGVVRSMVGLGEGVSRGGEKKSGLEDGVQPVSLLTWEWGVSMLIERNGSDLRHD